MYKIYLQDGVNTGVTFMRPHPVKKRDYISAEVMGLEPQPTPLSSIPLNQFRVKKVLHDETDGVTITGKWANY